MRRIIFILLSFSLLITDLYAQDMNSELSDFDFAVNELERNYAGFPRKTEGMKLTEYELLRDSLRNAVEYGKREGYDAVAELFAWFEDFHLQCGGWLTEKYIQRQEKSYAEECEYSPQSITARIDDNTFLIRFPSCGGKDPTLPKKLTDNIDEWILWVAEYMQHIQN